MTMFLSIIAVALNILMISLVGFFLTTEYQKHSNAISTLVFLLMEISWVLSTLLIASKCA